jgi:hypothetical protein
MPDVMHLDKRVEALLARALKVGLRHEPDAIDACLDRPAFCPGRQ